MKQHQIYPFAFFFFNIFYSPCYATNFNMQEIEGEWVVADVKLQSLIGVQIDNKAELIGQHLFIGKDYLKWNSASKSETGCLRPRLVKHDFIGVGRSDNYSYSIRCDNGMLFGNHSVLFIKSRSSIYMTWFDGETISLEKKK